LRLQIREAEELLRQFSPLSPLIDTSVNAATARAHLRSLAAEWIGKDHADRINFNRYLARCRIYTDKKTRHPKYSKTRLSFLASSLWYPSEATARMATSCYVCSRYAL
jgi:hypothetical protein